MIVRERDGEMCAAGVESGQGSCFIQFYQCSGRTWSPNRCDFDRPRTWLAIPWLPWISTWSEAKGERFSRKNLRDRGKTTLGWLHRAGKRETRHCEIHRLWNSTSHIYILIVDFFHYCCTVYMCDCVVCKIGVRKLRRFAYNVYKYCSLVCSPLPSAICGGKR